jgi:hypothetical protein
MNKSVFTLLLFSWVVLSCFPLSADDEKTKISNKEKFDLIFNQVFSSAGKARTIGQGMNDHAIPGRKESENFDQNDPAFKDWVRRKEEKERNRADASSRFREAFRNFSNRGGTQETVVPDHAKGENRWKELFKGDNDRKRPPSTMNADSGRRGAPTNNRASKRNEFRWPDFSRQDGKKFEMPKFEMPEFNNPFKEENKQPARHNSEPSKMKEFFERFKNK